MTQQSACFSNRGPEFDPLKPCQKAGCAGMHIYSQCWRAGNRQTLEFSGPAYVIRNPVSKLKEEKEMDDIRGITANGQWHYICTKKLSLFLLAQIITNVSPIGYG